RPPVFGETRHGPVLVGSVTERDGPRRTRLSASCRELVRSKLTALELRAVLRLTDPLHAERALLHDALPAHRDVGVQLPVERFGERVLATRRLTIAVPVEVPDLV